MKRLPIPDVLHKVSSVFSAAGFQCYLVGGALRNMVQNKHPSDFDLATNATPEQVIQLFKHVVCTGIKHGTVTVFYGIEKFEVTTFRIESAYSDARRPDFVSYTASIFEDLKRRDFTMNALALNLETDELLDPHNGIEDIKKGIIRAIGDPVERFTEDGLRPVRACRFAAELGFRIEKSTFEAITVTLEKVKSVSIERVRAELEKILHSPVPSKGLLLMEACGILPLIIPELSACKGITQKDMHAYDVFEHSLLACDGAPADSLVLRLAALFHDIGKPVVMKQSEETESDITFHRHEEVSAEMAEAILKRLTFPNAIIYAVAHLIRHHMFLYDDSWTDSAVRRFIARVGADHLDEVFSLRIADQYGMRGIPVQYDSLEGFKRRIRAVLENDHALTVKDLAVNGNDLAEKAEIPKGPIMGEVLNYLLEAVLDDPAQNTREKLLCIARNYYRSRIVPD